MTHSRYGPQALTHVENVTSDLFAGAAPVDTVIAPLGGIGKVGLGR